MSNFNIFSQLLYEIILVNDKSTRDYLYEPLEKYIKENFNGKVKMIVLPERSGLIRARMEGAKVATGEILVFVDAHVEANLNWLPPLIGGYFFNCFNHFHKRIISFQNQ